jgi:hypothetical protein
MKVLLLLNILFFICNPVYAQFHDLNWLFGYGGLPVGDKLGIVKINFEGGNPEQTEIGEAIYEFYGNTSVFSDSQGSLFAYFNGFDLNNARSEVMDNGKKFDVELVKFYRYLSDDALTQGSIFIEWPEHPDSILMLYSGQAYIDNIGLVCQDLSYAVIDRKANNGLGKVVAREQPIITDTINYAQITVIKHANGRDWWLPVREIDANRFYFFLIQPDGIKLHYQQLVDLPVYDGLGQSVFSPDGRSFATYNSLSATLGAWLDVFDFDRCNGALSRQRQIKFKAGLPGGLAFSPNSRFLYVSITDTLFQYDMEASDLAASRKTIKIRVPYPGTIFQPNYFIMGLAPDQRIYMSGTNSMLQLHVINNPDEEGTACDFQERGYKLLTNNFTSMPNFPNYRLGPLDGSSCDTLGLNNLPRAWWRSDRDSTDVLRRSFHDLSYYEPQSWSWDFGDPASGAWNSSTERHPEHVFSAPGKYEVCLKVKNGNGEHTFCRVLFVGITAAQDPEIQAGIGVSPNPFRDRLFVTLNEPLPSAQLHLFDLSGRLLLSKGLVQGINEIGTEDLPKGAYFWRVSLPPASSGRGGEGSTVKSGRVVKVE